MPSVPSPGGLPVLNADRTAVPEVGESPMPGAGGLAAPNVGEPPMLNAGESPGTGADTGVGTAVSPTAPRFKQIFTPSISKVISSKLDSSTSRMISATS